MLRYFYFLGIIYFINSSFCYDYLNEDVHQRNRGIGGQGDGHSRRKLKTPKKSIHRKRQHTVDNIEPLAQFNVVDFMQSYENTVDGRPRQADPPKYFRRRNSKDFNSYDSFDSLFNMEANDKRGDEWADAMEIEQNNAPEASSTAKMVTDQPNDKNLDYSFTVSDDPKENPNDNLENTNYLSKSLYDPTIVVRSPTVHNHQKKGVLKSIRFPFFSRNKAKTLAPTKDKKRMTSKSPKSEKSKSIVSDTRDNVYVMHPPSELFTKREIKRSYFEKICPACKKKYVANQKAVPRSEQVPEKMVHNSRQFFQNQVADRTSSKDKKKLAPQSDRRERRQYFDEKERQMKELEEVAKKVESVDVSYSVSTPATATLFVTTQDM